MKKVNIKNLSAGLLLLSFCGNINATAEQIDSFCKIDEGYKLYPSLTSTVAAGSSGGQIRTHDCLGDLKAVNVSGKETFRQKFIKSGEAVYVDRRAVLGSDFLLQADRVTARKGRTVFEDSDGSKKITDFWGKGKTIEYFKLVLDSQGQPVVQNKRVQVLVAQKQKNNNWISEIGWTSARGLGERIQALRTVYTQSPNPHVPGQKEKHFACPTYSGDMINGYSIENGKEKASFDQGEALELEKDQRVEKFDVNGESQFGFKIDFKGRKYFVLEKELVTKKEACEPQSKTAVGQTAASDAPSQKPKSDLSKRSKTTKVKVGLLDKVTCLNSGSVNLHNSVPGKGQKTQPIKLEDNQRLKVFPGDPVSSKIGGTDYKFIKVQVAASGQVGFIAQNFVQTSTACEKQKKANLEAEKKAKAEQRKKGEFFPLHHQPRGSYKVMPRSFGAYRSYQGKKRRRAHAATDLYSWVRKMIRAVRDGKIIRGPYYFYSNTYAVEMKHDNGRVVRYGETLARRLTKKKNVSAGTNIAQVGRLSCCAPMLHFEMYQGNRNGALTVKSRKASKFIRVGGKNLPAFRRKDLMNPTSYIDDLKRGL